MSSSVIEQPQVMQSTVAAATTTTLAPVVLPPPPPPPLALSTPKRKNRLLAKTSTSLLRISPRRNHHQQQQQHALQATGERTDQNGANDPQQQQQQLPLHVAGQQQEQHLDADSLPVLSSGGSSNIPILITSSLEVEAGSTSSGSTARWKPSRWFQPIKPQRQQTTPTATTTNSVARGCGNDDSCCYYGEPMTPDGLARSGSIKSQAMNPSSALLQPPQPLPPPAIPLTGSMAGSFSFPIEHSTSFQRVASWLRGGGRRLPYDNDDEEDDLRDFEASEWTPPDSSYGAAIPVAGWIPKNIRRTIEWTLMGGLLAIVCFWIVRTSVRADTNNLSNSSNSNRNSNHTTATNTSNSSSSYVNQYSKVSSYASYSGDLDLDDNRYISYKYMDNSYYQSDDDSQENAADDAFDYSSNQATTDDEMGGYAL